MGVYTDWLLNHKLDTRPLRDTARDPQCQLPFRGPQACDVGQHNQDTTPPSLLVLSQPLHREERPRRARLPNKVRRTADLRRICIPYPWCRTRPGKGGCPHAARPPLDLQRRVPSTTHPVRKSPPSPCLIPAPPDEMSPGSFSRWGSISAVERGRPYPRHVLVKGLAGEILSSRRRYGAGPRMVKSSQNSPVPF